MSGFVGKRFKWPKKKQKKQLKNRFSFVTSGASADINNLTELTKVCWPGVSWCSLTRSVRSEVVDHAVSFTTIEEEEVAVRSVSLGQSLKTKTKQVRLMFPPLVEHVTLLSVLKLTRWVHFSWCKWNMSDYLWEASVGQLQQVSSSRWRRQDGLVLM